MKWIIKILEIFLLSVLSGIIYYTLNYITVKLSEPNMIIEGIAIGSVLYGIINVLFIGILYFTTYLIDRKSIKKIFIFRKLLLEMIIMYVLIYLISHIPYTLNILPISKVTEKDLVDVFIPFIIMYISFICILLIKKNNLSSRRKE
jgi:peptidoglycan biosynthesis protein MviN/MurJ (putative lipid II flippase)